MLKQNQIVSDLRIFGQNAEALAFDLNFMDTKCRVQAYEYDDCNIKRAIRGADVIVMLGEALNNPYMSINEFVKAEGERVVEYARACTKYAPKSILVVACKACIRLHAYSLRRFFKKTAWYNPARIIGSADKIKHFGVEEHPHGPPTGQRAPFGGPRPSKHRFLCFPGPPLPVYPLNQTPQLMAKFRGIKLAEFPKKLKKRRLLRNFCRRGRPWGLHRLVTRVAMGLCGDSKACGCGFVRTNLVPTCKHLVTTLQFGLGGVIHNFGIPELNRTEMRMLTKAMLDIKNRENMAKDYVKFIDSGEECDEPLFSKNQALIEAAINKKIVKPLILDE
ncbi:unnamed protein product [Brassicogethes aeneus]|uniref:malate dehydrogenase n=1 Tax=Brassicogethes aeneus TaxID=1431903 RepID=A0A9P0BI13_BRAAE|nr:unnamed protein product [Brassicogethes aeneus]